MSDDAILVAQLIWDHGMRLLHFNKERNLRMAQETVNQTELYIGEAKYGDSGVVQAWRVVTRDDAGNPEFDAGGSPTGPQGTVNQEWVTRWMSGHPDPESGYPPTSPSNGRAEIELLTSQGWVNAATGAHTDVPSDAF